jgi:glycosyltransferase involved in cell wall biosynthesis
VATAASRPPRLRPGGHDPRRLLPRPRRGRHDPESVSRPRSAEGGLRSDRGPGRWTALGEGGALVGPALLVRVLLPVVAVVATVPPAIAGLDGASVPVTELLVPPCAALVLGGVGLTAAGVWRLVSLGARVAAVVGVLGAAVLLGEGIAVGAEFEPIAWPGLVHGAAGGAIAGAGLVGVLVRWRCRSRRVPPPRRNLRGRLIGGGAVVALVALTRTSVSAWLVAVGTVGIVLVGLPLLAGRLRARIPLTAVTADRHTTVAGGNALLVDADDHATIEVEPANPSRPVLSAPSLRILHLGPADPGTATTASAEVNRRLAAAGHEITVLSPRLPDGRAREEHHRRRGLRWTRLGPSHRVRPRALLTYAITAIIAARDVEADLVVEEFIAPLGSLAIPRWTRRPVVAVAEWLPAPPTDQWAPLLGLRWWAIETHRSVITRSPTSGAALTTAGVRADIAVVGSGIDPAARHVAPAPRGDDVVVRVGPVDGGAPAASLLLHAWALAAPGLPGQLVLLGTGPYEGDLRQCVARLGLAQRVEFADEADHAARFARMASARLAVVAPGAPSGAAAIAALEALSVGTMVLGPDTAALREVVPPTVGMLVPSTGQDDRDVAAIAHALRALHADHQRVAAAATHGPELARRHDRDVLTSQTEDIYRAAIARDS